LAWPVLQSTMHTQWGNLVAADLPAWGLQFFPTWRAHVTPPAVPEGTDHRPRPRHQLFRCRTPGLTRTWFPRAAPPKRQLTQQHRSVGASMCDEMRVQSGRANARVRCDARSLGASKRACAMRRAFTRGEQTRMCDATRVQSGRANARVRRDARSLGASKRACVTRCTFSRGDRTRVRDATRVRSGRLRVCSRSAVGDGTGRR
jgi:hypothetical protein